MSRARDRGTVAIAASFAKIVRPDPAPDSGLLQDPVSSYSTGPDAPARPGQDGRPPLSTRVPRAEVDDPRGAPGARHAPAVHPGARGRSSRLPQHGRAGLRAA